MYVVTRTDIHYKEDEIHRSKLLINNDDNNNNNYGIEGGRRGFDEFPSRKIEKKKEKKKEGKKKSRVVILY